MRWLSRNVVLALLVVVAGGFAWTQFQMMQMTRAVEGVPCPLVSEEEAGDGNFRVLQLAGDIHHVSAGCTSFLSAFRCNVVGPAIFESGGADPVFHRIAEDQSAVIFGRGDVATCTVFAS